MSNIKDFPHNLLKKLKRVMLSNPKRLKFFLKILKEEQMMKISERMTLSAFHKAVREVPAYAEFLETHNISSKQIRTYQDFVEKVPIMTKDNYLKKYPLSSICRYGNFKSVNSIYRTSGFSGKPLYIVATKEEELADEQAASNWFITQFGLKPSDLIINCLALGTWVGGLKVTYTARRTGVSITVGPRLDEVVEIINDLHDSFDKIVILAYPPFVLSIVNKLEEMNFDFQSNNFLFFAGGEGFDDSFPELIKEKTKNHGEVFSAYGSTETGVRVGNETAASKKLKQVVIENPSLCEELFGKPFPPMIFQFDPTQVNAVTAKNEDDKNLLIYTTIADKKQPVIKYNLLDEGGILRQKQVNEILAKYGEQLIKFTLPLPILYTYGRIDGTISICGSNIYPQRLQKVLLPYYSIIEDFKLRKETTKEGIPFPLIELLVEQKNLNKINSVHLEQQLAEDLYKAKVYYKELVSNGMAGPPKVVVHTHQNYPYEVGDKIKRQYVFKETKKSEINLN